MSMRNTNMLITDGLSLDQTGPATRADGYYGFADGMHTIGFYLKNFKGRLMIEASISDNPAESDWFPIGLGTSGLPYFSVDSAETKVETFNIVGNFVYLRAKIVRSHLNQTIDQLGTCERVILSL
jgi:hypothetical protein